jgi:hypothetical protein
MKQFHTMALCAAIAATGCTTTTLESEAIGTVEQRSLFAVEVGFVWANATGGSYTPLAAWSFNNSAGQNRVTWLATGRARVDFGNFQRDGGNAQVMAYGVSNHRCKVESWYLGAVSDALSVFVRCHAPDGSPVSTPFVVAYGDAVPPAAAGAYLWSSNASASHAPPARYSYNSAGQSNFVERTATGRYVVTMNGIAMWGGNVQVTAYGTGSEHCKVTGWGPSSGATRAWIACFDANGAAADARFSFRYGTDLAFYGLEQSFAWANNSFAASYTPSPTYQDYASCTYPDNEQTCVAGSDDTAGRTSTGKYWVRYPGAILGPTSALVTAYGSSSNYCKPEGWSGSASATVNVGCYDSAGHAVDTQFTQLFLSRAPSE